MIDLTQETPISIEQARTHRLLRCIGGDKGVHFSTVYGWIRTGRRGVKLESCRVAGTLCTTEEALIRFIERLSSLGATTETKTPGQHRKAAQRACDALKRMGI